MTAIFDKANARRATYYTLVFRVLGQLGGLVGSVLLIRLLSEAEFGVYSLMYATLPLLGTVASFGIANTLTRYLPEYFKQGQFTLAKKLFRLSSFARLILNMLILSIIVYSWETVSAWLKIENYKTEFLIFCVIGVTYFQMRLLSIALSSSLLQKYSQGGEAFLAFCKTVGYVGIAVAGFDLQKVMLVDLVSSVIVFMLLRVAYSRNIASRSGGDDKFSWPEKKRLIRYAAFYNLNDAGHLALDSKIDNFFIAAFMSPVAVGAYSFCTRLRGMVTRMMPTNYLLVVIQPLFFTLDYASDSDKKKVSQYYRLIIKGAYIAQIPVFFFVLSYSESLINVIFGGKFIEYSVALVAVFGFSMLSSFQMPIGLVAQLQERSGIIFASKLFALYNVAANLVLIPLFGVMGAVIATGTSVLFKNIFVWWFVREAASFSGTGKFFILSGAFWGVFFLLSLTFSAFIVSDAVLLMVALSIFVLWMIIYMRMPLFTEDEQELVIGVAGKKERKMLNRFFAFKL